AHVIKSFIVFVKKNYSLNMPQTACKETRILDITGDLSLSDDKENTFETISSLSESYDVLKELGRGRFAKVVHIRHRATGEESAAKLQRWRRMCGERSMKTLVDTEAAVLRLVRGHRGFVQLRACLATPQESIILMEACCGGSLQDAVGLLSESELTQPSHLAFCRLAAARLFAALAYLHQRRLCHLDVKPCNLLLRSPYSASCCDLCLCDFGLAKRLDGGPQEANRTLDGTPDYAAPEVLAYEPFSFAADLWSSGAVLFFAATGVSPFAASVSEPKQVVYSRVATVACDWSLLASHPAESLVRRLLNKSPSLRPTAEEAAGHEFAAPPTAAAEDPAAASAEGGGGGGV
ncbi:hypothetical protein BOX15_Mlig017622g1, partial [Macrostomum lignano]